VAPQTGVEAGRAGAVRPMDASHPPGHEHADAHGDLDLTALMQELPAIVFVAESGPDGDWLYVSQQIEAILGLTAEEWRSHPRPFATYVHEDDFPELLALEEQLVRERDFRPFELEFRMRRRDGTVLWIQERARLIERDGKVLVQGMYIDVTAWRDAEMRLADANRHLSALVDTWPLAVLTWDREGRILTWNPAAERMFGWTATEAIGRYLPQVQDDAKDEMKQFIEQGFLGQIWTDLEIVRQRKDGSLIDVQISSAGLRDDRGQITAMMSVISDITERKRAQKLFRAQELELRQREQLDAIGKLAGGIAHDFNNLLTAIHGQALLALDELRGDPRAGNVEPIVDAAERAGALTRQLLAFGRRQVLEPRVLHVNDVVESILPLLRRLAGEAISVRTALGDELPPVEADPTQLDQVLVNLVSNARDAMPRGGAIEIVTRVDEIDRPDEPGTPAGRYTVLSVSDTGTGMDEAVRARVFEPFFTTKETGKGSGLGLSTVYGIVAQSGGFVDLETQLGGGSTFSVHLPAVARVEVEADEPAVSADSIGGGGERVLLVEDEKLVRDLIERVLVGEGYTVDSAASPAEALADHDPRTFDLLVSDVVMPGISGPELAARMRMSNPYLAVLFISGYNETAVAGYGVLGHAVDLLQKPFTPTVLKERVRSVLQQRAAAL
jgi:two-component system cell cycle sensor histidine kinase/response regulator CckA